MRLQIAATQAELICKDSTPGGHQTPPWRNAKELKLVSHVEKGDCGAHLPRKGWSIGSRFSATLEKNNDQWTAN